MQKMRRTNKRHPKHGDLAEDEVVAEGQDVGEAGDGDNRDEAIRLTRSNT